MKTLLSILLLCIFCVSCKKENVTVVTSFPQTGKLQASIKQMPVSILLPRYIGIAGEQLFIYKEKEEYLFTFFRIPDCTYLGDAGTRGQGPNEFNLLDTRSFSSFQEGFNVLEAGSNLFKTVTYKEGQLKVMHTQQIFDNGVSNNGFYLLADSIYLTLGRIDEKNEYCLFNKKTNTVVKTDPYPHWVEISQQASTPPLFVTYLKSCVVHPNGKKFAAFYGRFKRVRIYDHTAHLLHDIDVRINPYSTNFEKNVQNQPVYYIGQPYATNDYIYALCANSISSNSKELVDYELQVWTWDGKPAACFKFDRKVSMMAISEKYKKIYAIDNTVDNKLFVYDLPQIKKT